MLRFQAKVRHMRIHEGDVAWLTKNKLSLFKRNSHLLSTRPHQQNRKQLFHVSLIKQSRKNSANKKSYFHHQSEEAKSNNKYLNRHNSPRPPRLRLKSWRLLLRRKKNLFIKLLKKKQRNRQNRVKRLMWRRVLSLLKKRSLNKTSLKTSSMRKS